MQICAGWCEWHEFVPADGNDADLRRVTRMTQIGQRNCPPRKFNNFNSSRKFSHDTLSCKQISAYWHVYTYTLCDDYICASDAKNIPGAIESNNAMRIFGSLLVCTHHDTKQSSKAHQCPSNPKGHHINYVATATTNKTNRNRKKKNSITTI